MHNNRYNMVSYGFGSHLCSFLQCIFRRGAGTFYTMPFWVHRLQKKRIRNAWKAFVQSLMVHCWQGFVFNPFPPLGPLRGSKCQEAEVGIPIMWPLWMSFTVVTWSESFRSQVYIRRFPVPGDCCAGWFTQGCIYIFSDLALKTTHRKAAFRRMAGGKLLTAYFPLLPKKPQK